MILLAVLTLAVMAVSGAVAARAPQTLVQTGRRAGSPGTVDASPEFADSMTRTG